MVFLPYPANRFIAAAYQAGFLLGATAKTIDKDGWLHSGDLAVKTSDGFYLITGRIKDRIIRGGENIYPREIENFLYQMPQIEMVEVAGIQDVKYGEIVGAFIKLREMGLNYVKALS